MTDAGASPTLGEIGEFGLLAKIRARVPSGEGVLIGIGDDAALLQSDGGMLASTDMLVEGLHFDLAFCTPADAGFKAIAVNVSDIAAMGGRARYALVCLAAPPQTRISTLEELYTGLLDACRKFEVSIVGGDLTGSPQLSIAISMLGDPSERVIPRSGARAGDVLCVTGSLGAAASGLALARLLPYDVQAASLAEQFPTVLAAHRRPLPRIDVAARLSEKVSAMIDVSDGLAKDAGHIAEESHLGLDVYAEHIPIADGVAETAELLGADPSIIAAGGGDDYELCFACAPEHLAHVRAAISPVPVTQVGVFSSDVSTRVLHWSSRAVPLSEIGWEHFA